jgi:competence protein ComEC
MSDSQADNSPLARIWFMDVGSGDCTLVMDVATKRALLVDCPTWRVQEVQRLLSQEGIILDTVIVTHWDLDHYGGASRLAVGLPVNRIVYNHETLFPDSATPENLIRTALKNFLNIKAANQKLGPAEAGESGSFGSVAWHLLAPTHAELTTAYVERKRNVASAVVDVRVGSFRALIGGDAVGATWQRLLDDANLDSDVLRWPHHGADLAGDQSGDIRDRVFSAVKPTYVVISAGTKNLYGHPSADVIYGASSQSSVLCTQVTPGCFGFISSADRRTTEAKSIAQGLQPSNCAGTVYVECLSDGFTITPSPSDHRTRVESWPHPLCKA